MSKATSQLRIRAGLRILALILLLGAILDPDLPFGRSAIDVVVLVDDSASVDRDTVDARWPEIVQLLSGLPKGRRDILRFANEPVLDHAYSAENHVAPASMPRTRELDRNGTDIAAALNAGLHRLRPRRMSALVLATDGGENHGDATRILEEAQRAGVAVFALDLREPMSRPRLSGWEIPREARIGQSLEATATVRGVAAGRLGIDILIDDIIAERHTLELTDNADASARFVLAPRRPGPMRIGFRLTDPAGNVIEHEPAAAIIDVYGPPSLLFVTERPDAALAGSLGAGGFAVEIVSPMQLDSRTEHLPGYHAVILDDIPAAALTGAVQRALADMVRNHGTGLVVLGGRSSFAAGAYRNSELESLLPVTAEPPEPQRKASVMFLVDNSGSMGQAPQGVPRLDAARAAVLETARSLSDADRVSLASFAVEPRIQLAPGNYGNLQRQLEEAWRFSAQGGTSLAPALELAATTLAGGDTAQNLLVLVTDGFIEGTDLAFGRQILAENRIELIALAIGEESDLDALQSLAGAYGGRVLKVERIAQLPRLMRKEVEARRQPTAEGFSELQVHGALPTEFPQTENWPPVNGFAVTRPRDDANVLVRAASGEAVLVEHMSGAGRVLVFTPGIGEFTSNWGSWSEWPRFAGGLVERVSPMFPSARTGLNIVDEPGFLNIEVDLRDSSGAWNSDTHVLATSLGPDKTTTTTEALPVAPGRFLARVAAASSGVYRVTVNTGDAIVRRSHVRGAAGEVPLAVGEGPLNDWLASGLLEPLSTDSAELLARKATASARPLLTILALLIMLLLWAGERLWPPLRAPFGNLAGRFMPRLRRSWSGMSS